MKAKMPYFGFFKYIQINFEREKSITNIFLLNNTKKVIKLIAYDEIKNIVNNLISLCGVDIEGKTYFKNEEIFELANSNWNGRYWLFSNGFLHIGIDLEKCLIYFDIIFNKNNKIDG